jgi:excisionase family DNA binding protein
MEVLDIAEACSFLRIAKPTLYKYIRKGQIPAFKMGRVWRFHRETLESWVKGRVSEDTEARSQKTSARVSR